MDPESGLDAIRNVGIAGDRIMRISEEPLHGKRVIDVRGLILAPGFIDLHQHAQDPQSGRLKAFDGVTTALEMEIGAPDVAAFLQRKKGRSFINYGTTASHAAARSRSLSAPPIAIRCWCLQRGLRQTGPQRPSRYKKSRNA